MEKPVTIPWTPGGSPTSTASPLAISARLARAIACTDARWFLTRRRSRSVTRHQPGSSSVTWAPIVPEYGVIQPTRRLKSVLPPGTLASRRQEARSRSPGADMEEGTRSNVSYVMAERRYSDKEIAAIFRAATELPPVAERAEVPRDEGLTLADLQAIGREVGIPAEAVAQAAQALDVRPGAASRTFLGLPIGVSRTVDLNRRLTDEEWERLVVQLREVFNARGRTRSDGSLRQWTNGNLQVLLEPTDTGHRLRFGTVHGAARASIGAGIFVLGITATVAMASALGGYFGEALPGMALPFFAGVAMIVSGAVRLPRWARLRERQLEALAAKVVVPPGSSTPP